MTLNNLIIKEIEQQLPYAWGVHLYYQITKIITDKFEILIEEDSGGEFACLQLEDCPLRIDDVISFYGELDEYGCLFGVNKININNVDYECSVYSEGGNDCVYLTFLKK